MQPTPDPAAHRVERGREAIVVQRIYDHDDETGYRVLVDRLWPRGVAKRDAALDEWLKDAAPSTELRRWYGHVPARFAEFRDRYREELDQAPAADAVRHLRDLQHPHLVLLTATRDIERSGALVLCDHVAALHPPDRRHRHQIGDLTPVRIAAAASRCPVETVSGWAGA